MDTINDQMFFLDRESVKPAMWSRLLYNDDVYHKQIHTIFQSLLDPRMIFFDKDLTFEEIKHCIIIFYH